ncbi:FAD-dependent oxidoreductase [Calothrix sp. UHCC 0171]|uniref:FAD-dependent oxidoreductase n=1 Tax=Calothrix sp. UHCC 0171 TaxID=3110245 RepID=UPI002B207447|nr:FAD-dependent monooxygenase [Calothrix sp. UHCC 0171]MEA5572920.1 FAD-dependent monooxygenase [Calothrix sp. UHCC 0171]
MISTPKKIGIVGGGTTGLYLAILLEDAGFEVSVFERAPQARVEGCGILLIPSGLEALSFHSRELCDEVIQAGVKVRTYEFRSLLGKVVSSDSAGDSEVTSGFPNLTIHRENISQALLRRVPTKCLHFDHYLESIASKNDQVIATFRNGKQWEGDLLVGTDGLNSQVRNFVAPGIRLSYLGDMVWRGILPTTEVCPDGYFVVYIRARGVYANTFDIGNGSLHWGFFIEHDQPKDEKGILVPKNCEIPSTELEKLPEAMRRTIEMTPPENIVCRYSYDIDPLPQIVSGNVVLLGDAAHAKSPARAQGMSSGLQDAVLLSKYLTSSATIEAALAGYQQERLPVVHELQLTSRAKSQETGRIKKLATSV